MRYLIVGDVHYTEQAPERRKPEYGAQILEKLGWCAATAARLKVDAVLFTGDLFHRKRPSILEVDRLIIAFSSFSCPIYSIVGNHDVIGHNSTDLSNTGIGVLFDAGIINRIEGGAISGSDYCPDYERSDPYEPRGIMDGEACIHITHGMLVQKKLPYEASHTLLKHLGVAHSTLIINGHNHTPWESDNIWNVGSLCRASIEDQHTNHEPRVLVAIRKDDLWKVKAIPVPIEEDVWTDEQEVVRALDNEAIAEFVEKLAGEEMDLSEGRSEALDKLMGRRSEGVKETVRGLIASQEE